MKIFKIKLLVIAVILSLNIHILYAAVPLSESTLNIYNPLVLNGSRCTGLGGAVVSLGDSADDIFFNCAASSLRNKFQKSKFEFDYTLFFANVFSKNNIDYRNAKTIAPDYSTEDLQYISFALLFLYKRWSLSISISASSIDFIKDTEKYFLQETLLTVNVAHELIPKRLFAAIGLIIPTLTLQDDNDNKIVEYQYKDGIIPNPQVGLIYSFENIPLKLGINAKFNINGTINTNVNVATNFVLPKEIRHPFTLTVGASWKFSINNNYRHIITTNTNKNIKKKKSTKMIYSFKPEYCMISADLKIIGEVNNGVDILSYTGTGTKLSSGNDIYIEPRFGIELSFPTWLKLRTGYYYESPRIDNTPGRHHMTFNCELSLFKIKKQYMAVAFTMDWAKRFWSAGISAKFWKY